MISVELLAVTCKTSPAHPSFSLQSTTFLPLVAQHNPPMSLMSLFDGEDLLQRRPAGLTVAPSFVELCLLHCFVSLRAWESLLTLMPMLSIRHCEPGMHVADLQETDGLSASCL